MWTARFPVFFRLPAAGAAGDYLNLVDKGGRRDAPSQEGRGVPFCGGVTSPGNPCFGEAYRRATAR